MDDRELADMMRGALDAIWDEMATLETVWEVLDNDDTVQDVRG